MNEWVWITAYQVRQTIPSTSLYKILRFLAWDVILCDMGTHTPIERTREERTELEQRIRTGNAPARTHTRARILLLSDRSQGQKRTDQEGADAVLCCNNTVRPVRFTRVRSQSTLFVADQPLAMGLIRLSATISPRLSRAKPACASRKLQRRPSRPSAIGYRLSAIDYTAACGRGARTCGDAYCSIYTRNIPRMTIRCPGRNGHSRFDITAPA